MSPAEKEQALDIALQRWVTVGLAKQWLGTPFHHGAAVMGSGVDCAHLAASVYEEAGVLQHGKIGYYSPDWFLHEDAERLLERVGEFCLQVTSGDQGDLALFAFGKASAHVGIVVEWPMIIHADRNLGEVVRLVVEPEGPMARRFTGFWSPKSWHAESDPSHHSSGEG